MSTTPEEIRALQSAGEFLIRLHLMRLKDLRKSAPQLRDEAYRILRHYPGRVGIEMFWKLEAKNERP